MKKMRLLKMTFGVCLICMVAIVGSVPAFAKEIAITVNDHNPERSVLSQAIAYWAKKANEMGAGKFKITVHHSGVLLTGEEAYRGAQTGIVDAAHYVVDRRDGFMLNTVITLPFMGYPNPQETGEIYRKLREKFPEVRGEFKEVIPFAFCMMPPTHIHSKNKVIKTPADLKGMKMHGAEYALVQVLGAAGATPVQIDIADMYMALDRGLLDGVMNHFPVLLVFGALPLLHHHTVFGEGGINMTPMGIVWNEKKWNSYPRDVQKILTDSARFYIEKFYEIDAEVQAALGFAKENNHTFTYLTDNEIKVWYDLVKKPIHDKWIEEAEAKGLPGKAVYKYALKLVKKAK
jgi:TRAP-type C4-dicarboxylate transport system substrate-binding protein